MFKPETKCTFEFQGKQFTSGGAYILPCTDGKYRGVVYIVEKADQSQHALATMGEGVTRLKSLYATTWHGEIIAPLRSHTLYRGNFCKMARISFDYEGRRYVGDYCPDWASLCKVRSTK
jgi:hypothetical protein